MILRQRLDEELPSHILAQFYKDTPILEETRLARALPPIPRLGYYRSRCSVPISIRFKDSAWHVILHHVNPGRLYFDVAKVLQWLDLSLQDHKDFSPFKVPCPKVDEEPFTFADPADLQNGTLGLGCWRRKIIEANVFKNPIPAKRPWVPLHNLAPHPFNRFTQDGLMLTASALWSLFDNSLYRLPHCTCSLGSAGGDIIQGKATKKKLVAIAHTCSR